MTSRKLATGFTIVELLIVIVVIAILAAISIVAYNGIQQRAKNSATLTAVQQVYKLLQMYETANGNYPSGYSYACIGEYENDICQYINSSAEVSEQSSFKTAISTVGSMPQPNAELFSKSSNRTGGGAFYRVSQRDIVYHLIGLSQPCSAGGVQNNSGQVTTCTYPLP